MAGKMGIVVQFVLFVLVNVATSADDNQPFKCADGSRPVQCFVEPCAVTKCAKHPNASCGDDYCGGCNAKFYDDDNNEITDDCIEDDQPFKCVDGSSPVQCFVAPCGVTQCAKHPNARCEDDYCGGCNAKFYDDDNNEITDDCIEDNQAFKCVDGSSPVECFAEPCAVTKCAKHPNARCEDDYCGGCNAKFYDDDNNEITDDCCDEVSKRAECPGGLPLVECFVEPCAMNKCENHPTAECIDDYCGGCRARYFVASDEVTSDCRAISKRAKCPGGLPLVECLVEPCAVNKCENHPTAECIDDYCGGCRARYFVAADEVTSDCRATNQPQLCVDGSSPFNCFVEPCRVTKCKKYPDAICLNDYCGGCSARFTVNGTEVTGACN